MAETGITAAISLITKLEYYCSFHREFFKIRYAVVLLWRVVDKWQWWNSSSYERRLKFHCQITNLVSSDNDIDEKDKGRDGCSLATLKPLVDVNHDGQASIAKITKPRCLNGGQCYAKVRDEVKTSVITPFQNNNKLWERARAKAGVELLFILYHYPMWDSQSTPSSRSGHDI
jgi:hypothetical protein